MKKKLLTLLTVLALTLTSFAAFWRDPATDIMWKYFITEGKATIGDGDYKSAAISKSTSVPKQGFAFLGWNKPLNNIQSNTTVRAKFMTVGGAIHIR